MSTKKHADANGKSTAFIRRVVAETQKSIPAFDLHFDLPPYPGLGAKPSQPERQAEFLELAKADARRSPDSRSVILRTPKTNGYAVFIQLTKLLQVRVTCRASGKRLEGYEWYLRDHGVFTAAMFPTGDTPCVLLAEAVAYVHQAPGQGAYEEAPTVEVGHNGVETASLLYLSWRSHAFTSERACPVSLALQVFAGHTITRGGWGDHHFSGARVATKLAELEFLRRAFDEHPCFQIVEADVFYVDAEGMVTEAAQGGGGTSFRDFLAYNERIADEREGEGFVLYLNSNTALQSAGGKTPRFHIPHQNAIPRDALSLKNKRLFYLSAVVHNRPDPNIPRREGKFNLPVYARWKDAVHRVGTIERPPKALYSLDEGAYKLYRVRCTWGSTNKGTLTGIKNPREEDLVQRRIDVSQIKQHTDAVDECLNAVPHFRGVIREHQKLKVWAKSVQDDCRRWTRDGPAFKPSEHIAGLPKRGERKPRRATGAPPSARLADEGPWLHACAEAEGEAQAPVDKRPRVEDRDPEERRLRALFPNVAADSETLKEAVYRLVPAGDTVSYAQLMRDMGADPGDTERGRELDKILDALWDDGDVYRESADEGDRLRRI